MLSPKNVFATGSSAIQAIAFSQDGQRLAALMDRRRLRIWNLVTGTVERNFRIPKLEVEAGPWQSFNLDTGLPTLLQQQITLIDLASKADCLLESDFWELFGFSTSANNRFVIDRKNFYGWDLQEQRALPTPAAGPPGGNDQGFVPSAKTCDIFLPQSSYFVAIWWILHPGWEYIPAIIDPLTGEWVSELTTGYAYWGLRAHLNLIFSPDGRWVIGLYPSDSLLWQGQSPYQYQRLDRIYLPATQGKFTADSRNLITMFENHLQVWPVGELPSRANYFDTRSKRFTPLTHEFPGMKLTCLDYSAQTSQIAVGTDNSKIILLDFLNL